MVRLVSVILLLKSNAKKVRKIDKRNVIAGFAGSTSDALTLFERIGGKT